MGLDPFQFGFRSGVGMEMTLVALPDYFCQENDGGGCMPIDSPGSLSSFQYHQPWLAWLGVGGTIFCCVLLLLDQPIPEGGTGGLLLCPLAFMLGVPQDPILFPMLVIMKLLGDIIQEFGVQITPCSISP